MLHCCRENILDVDIHGKRFARHLFAFFAVGTAVESTGEDKNADSAAT